MVFSYQARAEPKPGMDKLVEGAMQMFAEWVLTQPGILHIHQLKDLETGALVGISFWERKEDCERALTLSAQAPEANAKQKALTDALQKPLVTCSYDVIWQAERRPP